MINKTNNIRRTFLIMAFIVFFCCHASSQQNFSVEELYVLNKEKLEKGASLKDNVQSSLESPVNLLTGAVDFDIPIHTIKIDNYSLPISLHYETSGFRLTDLSSSIGLGWTIKGLGCITKTIKDVPDNTSCGYNSAYNYEHIAHFFNLDTITDNDDKRKLAELTHYSGCDKEPDIYSFNFPEHSGSFLFDEDNNIYMIPQQDLIISYNNNVFIITDELGNKYYFGEGNSRDSLKNYNNTPIWKTENEWTNYSSTAVSARFGYNYGTNCLELDKNYTTSWYLSKIKLASSNAEILIDYEREYLCAYIGSDETYMYGRCYDINNPNGQPSFTSPGWMALRINRFKHIYEPRITSIVWKQDHHELGSIDFVPSEEFRDDLQNESGSETAHAIERINIKNSNTEICTSFKLYHHKYYGNVDYKSYRNRLFLIMLEVSDSDDNAMYNYQFTYNYNFNDNYYKNSAKIDYWGYYKPRGNNYGIGQECHLMKPTIYYYEDGVNDPLYKSVYSVWERTGKQPTYTLEGNDMSPAIVNPNAAVGYNSSLFTLTTIDMPLGASIEFKYENNKFHFDSQDILGPGVRVKKVIYKDGNNNYETTYEYLDNDGKSSGRIASIPDFGYLNTTAIIRKFYLHQSSDDERNIMTARQISTVSDMYGSSQANVRYGKVTVKNAQTGKTEYYNHLVFNAEDNSVCIGDNAYISRTQIKRAKYTQLAPNMPYNGVLSSDIIPHEDSFPKFTEPITSWCGNYLKKTIVYNINNEIIESTEYKYSLKPSDITLPYLQSRYYTRFDCPWAILDEYGNAYDLPYVLQRDILWGTNSYRTGVRRLDSIVNIKYDGGIENRTVTAYQYYDDIGKKLFVKEKSIKNSDGMVEKTNYIYPFNYNTNTSIINTLTDRNMIATPIEEYISIDGKVIDGIFKEYGLWGTYVKPNKIYKLRTNTPLSDFIQSTPYGKQDRRYEEVMSLRYDNTSGNTIETVQEGNSVTTYVWGYHHSLLLAIVKNATKNEVAGGLSCTMDELQNKTDSDELIHIFNNLRENMSDALITSYTYDASQHPLSVTDPTGKTCKYEYDDALRLKLIRDQDNNIVKTYDYHYR